MKNVLLYLRCAVANRYTLAGYLIVFMVVPLMFYLPAKVYLLPLWVVFWGGLALLGVTAFGRHTLRAYRRVTQSADRFGRADDRVVSTYDTYCDITGARMAQRDLQKRLQNKSRTE